MSRARSVAIVDLGMGNLRSVARAIERAGGAPIATVDPDTIARADRLIVPGQGQFRDCAAALAGPIGAAVRDQIASGRPYLGICLGMQALLAASEEAPGAPGLGIVPGTVRRFARDLRSASGERLKVPHVGWSEIEPRHPLLGDRRAWFYFVHSYVCVPEDRARIAAEVDHGGPFCAAIVRDNVLAVQFHPEKSAREGHALLERFLAWS